MQLDPAGNILRESNKLQREYCYNAQNRISEYYENGQLKARYHYNALGQRVHKAILQADGTEAHTLFHYGQQGELLGETHLADNGESSESGSSQNIVWLQMRPVVALDSSASSTNSKPADTQISWLHSDHLLTARAATDANQHLIWRWHSDAFGIGEAENFAANGQNNQSTEEQFTLNLRFPGQYHDAESGLHYNYRRTYDPSMGRYTQSDPIGLMGGVNTFAYVANNPISSIDPTGLDLLVIVGEKKPESLNYFGHVAIAVAGEGVWSFGNGTSLGSSVNNYLNEQIAMRDNYLFLIPTTSMQDEAALAYLKKQKDDIGKVDNCAARTSNALNAAGINVFSRFPKGVMNELMSMSGVSGSFISMGSYTANIPGF